LPIINTSHVIKLAFAGLLCVLLVTACSSPRATSSVGAPSGPNTIDQIRLVALPVALNLDRRPGVDGFGIKVYGLNQNQAKPQEIRRGTIEIVMYDGLLPSGTNVIEPRCTWSYPATELRQYELKSTIGLAYQIAPRWGEKKPEHNRITVVARYKMDADTMIESAPSVISVPSQ
jgi:hypothetical protein